MYLGHFRTFRVFEQTSYSCRALLVARRVGLVSSDSFSDKTAPRYRVLSLQPGNFASLSEYHLKGQGQGTLCTERLRWPSQTFQGGTLWMCRHLFHGDNLNLPGAKGRLLLLEARLSYHALPHRPTPLLCFKKKTDGGTANKPHPPALLNTNSFSVRPDLVTCRFRDIPNRAFLGKASQTRGKYNQVENCGPSAFECRLKTT